MRMHEILGLEPLEEVTYAPRQGKQYWMKFYIDSEGVLRSTDSGMNLTGTQTAEIINHPEYIIRKEQVEALKALKVLGYAYVTEDEFGPLCAHEYLPAKRNIAWRSNGSVWKDSRKRLADLVSWSDPEPLDIVQTLKNAGVEV